MEKINEYIHEANTIFSDIPVFTILNYDKEFARNYLLEIYGSQDKQKIERYLETIEKLKCYFEKRRKEFRLH